LSALKSIYETLTWANESKSEIPRFKQFLMKIFLRVIKSSRIELDQFLDMGDSAFERLLLSPPVSAMLRTIHINQYRLDMMVEFEAEMTQYLKAFSGMWDKPVRYVCPTGSVMFGKNLLRLENPRVFGIICDFDFPLVWDHLDIASDKFEGIGERADQMTCLAKIEEALDFIRAKNEKAFSFVKTFTRIIHIRKSPDGVPPGSSSNLLRNGATVLRGVELEEINVYDVAEFILHEAIHHCLYIYEILEKEFVCEHNGLRPMNLAIESPWSANRIAVDSFCHACFVWYGLYNFWHSIDSNAVEVKLKRHVSAEGFLKPVPLSNFLTIHGLGMGIELEECLREMQNDVLKRENIR
jgi:hypothetical protein